MDEPIPNFKTREGEAETMRAYDSVLAHWPVPYEELDLPTRFGNTHAIASGPSGARPIILLHGQDSCAISWIYNVSTLSQTFRTYAVDTIGDMGRSQLVCLPRGRQDYAEWLLDALDKLKIEKADLMGLSYGGFLAANFALAYPERVNCMVLLAPGIPNFGPPTLQWANYGMPMMLLPSRFTVKRFINGVSTKGYSREDLVHEQMITGMINMRHVSFIRPVFTGDEFKQMMTPTLLLVGDHEIMYEPQKALHCAEQLIPNLQTGLIPNAGHMLNGDQPEIVNEKSIAFLMQN